MPELKYWDIIYYYKIHCARQIEQWKNPVSYNAFCIRLKKMDLRDAIYMPRVEYNVRYRKKTPIQDEIRRKQINKYVTESEDKSELTKGFNYTEASPENLFHVSSVKLANTTLEPRKMTKERILIMIEKLLKIYFELDEWEEENNLVEFMWEDDNGNGIYKLK